MIRAESMSSMLLRMLWTVVGEVGIPEMLKSRLEIFGCLLHANFPSHVN